MNPRNPGDPQRLDFAAQPNGDLATEKLVEKIGTDLPVPLCGTGGSATASEREALTLMVELLECARNAVLAPPLTDTSILAAEHWVEQVRTGIEMRRWMMHIVRDARLMVREEWRTRRMLDRELVTVRRHQRPRKDLQTLRTNRNAYPKSRPALLGRVPLSRASATALAIHPAGRYQ